MGKDRKKKFKVPKQRPTGLPSVREFEEELRNGGGDSIDSINSDTSTVVAEVLEKLQSGQVEEREIGCSILVGLVSQSEAISTLLKHNIIRILGPLIVDPSPDVRCRSLGVLRNISVDGGHAVCEEMIQKDVMTPLVALFHKYGISWNPEEETKSTDSAVDIYIEAVHLLWNLCESSDIAVKIFNKENLIQHLLPCLNYETYTFPLAVAVAQCLHTVAEDNKQMGIFCKQGEVMGKLQQLTTIACDTTDAFLLRTLSTGIIVNIYGEELVSVNSSLVSAIIKSAAEVLDMNIRDNINTYIHSTENGNGLTVNTEVMEGAEHLPEESISSLTNPSDDNSKELTDIENLLNAQRLSSEIIANLCCSDDDGFEELHESSSTEDLTTDTDMGTSFSPLCLSSEVHSEFLTHSIFSKLLDKAECLTEEQKTVLQRNSQGQKVLRSYMQVQEHSLLSAHNMINAIDDKDLGGLQKLETVWEGLAKLSTSKQASEDKSFLEAVTSAMRAVIQKLSQLKSSNFEDITKNDLEYLYNISITSDNTIKINIIRIVSTIGCILATNLQPHPMLKDIGVFLIKNCRDPDLLVTAEALDSIFDVFGEDHIDSIVKEINLIQELRTILPPLKAKISKQKKILGDKYPIVATARTNLIKFIRYKS
ncbi:hypothetical protein LOTGIDRAFT_229792 [Lottia gigantea]|uniref:SYO1-like TPR repeats domain-containing protein n=1 Tax=Lottia gigantea TaxID=225164 RepID=V3ZF72_LOTGI|nr:hypothetical protein LOTGIDRAFT_229792 [Lottia gigantea]ESO82767.1 hypothetical protein LOTGIDRAFT_229792 [Lottia gigantea]